MTGYFPPSEQVGGSHYKSLSIDAYQFCMHNDWDCAAFTILKRLIRFKAKEGATDLRKALHEIDIRVNLYHDGLSPRVEKPHRIKMADYIEQNGFTDERVCMALRSLESWVNNNRITDQCVPHIKANIEAILAEFSASAPAPR